MGRFLGYYLVQCKNMYVGYTISTLYQMIILNVST